MKSKTILFSITLFFFFLGPAHISFAESTINCHCFQDRSYDPGDKFASDDYILATSFNSLLARSFDIPKEQVVRLKMEERVGPDDLLIGLKLTKLTGGYLEQLLGLSRVGYSWAQIVKGMDQQATISSDKLAAQIKSGLPAEAAGARVADELIQTLYTAPPEDIQRFRSYGLSAKELTLVYILAHFQDRRPETFIEQYKKQGSSWSEIAFGLGIEPAAAGKLVLAYPEKNISN